MKSSTESINQNVFNLSETDRVAYITAHPDDTSMFMAYAISHHADFHTNTGQRPYAYVASDGEASTKGDPEFVRSGGRRIEAIKEAEFLGIPSNRIHFPGLPDGRLMDHQSGMSDDIEEYIGANGISKAITMGEFGGDGHPDHIATHVATLAVRSSFPNLEVFGVNSQGKGEVVIPNMEINIKLGGLALNASQFSISASPTHVSKFRQIGDFWIPDGDKDELTAYNNFLKHETYDVY